MLIPGLRVQFKKEFIMFFIFLFIVFNSSFLSALEIDRLSLRESFERALRNNPQFALDRESWELIKSRHDQDQELTVEFDLESELLKKDQLGLYGPGLHLNADLSYDQLKVNIPVVYGQKTPNSVGINMQTVLDDNLDLFFGLSYDQEDKESVSLGVAKSLFPTSAKDIEELREERALVNDRLNFLEAENQLLYSVLDRYTGVLQAEKKLVNINFELGEAQRELEIVEKNVESGKSPYRSLESAEDRVRELEIEVEHAEQSVIESRELLASLLDLKIDQLPEELSWVFDLEIDPFYLEQDVDSALDMALERRLDFRQTEMNESITEHQLQRVKDQNGWDVGVKAEYSADLRAGESNYLASLWASKSVFDPERERDIKEKEIEYRRARLAFKNKLNQIESELRGIFRSLRTADLAVQHSERNLSSSREAEKRAINEYEKGLITEAERDARFLEREFCERDLSLAHFAQFRAQLDLLDSLGIRLAEGLNLQPDKGD